MPIVDEFQARRDRPRRPAWLWVVVIAGLALVWFLLALVLSEVPHSIERKAPPTAAPTAPDAKLLDDARMQANMQIWPGVLVDLQAVQPARLSTIQKHSYLKLDAEAELKAGSAARASALYERFITMALRLRAAECRSCHAGTASIPPTTLAAEASTKLGAGYVAALKKAGRLTSTRAALQRRLRDHPADPRANLLLAVIERQAGDRAASRAHVERLRKMEAPGVSR